MFWLEPRPAYAHPQRGSPRMFRVAVAVGLAVGIPMRAALGATWFAPAFAGLTAGYLWYDLTHYAVHHLRPRTALGEMQRRNHMIHHFKRPDRLFGVTTPLWDLVFGTWTGSPRSTGPERRLEASGYRLRATGPEMPRAPAPRQAAGRSPEPGS